MDTDRFENLWLCYQTEQMTQAEWEELLQTEPGLMTWWEAIKAQSPPTTNSPD